MIKTVEAIFDGQVFRPSEPVELKPNTRVRIIIETMLPEGEKVTSFLRTARALNLEGAPDWSVNLDEHFRQAGFHILLSENAS
jgi:predicted DNA-binding antitoxin AbrB/MazE fold protein